MRILAIDVGMGTTDILVFDSRLEMENCTKLVIPSATKVAAARIRRATEKGRPVFFRGETMGGGPCGKALREHLLAGLGFYATVPAALTFNDDLERVGSWGVTILEGDEPDIPGDCVTISSGDVDAWALRDALDMLNAGSYFDGAAIAVQDHGFSPGLSNRRRRFQLWRRQLAESSGFTGLAWRSGEIPSHYSRMQAAADLIGEFGEAIAMDTGPAAIWGVLPEGTVSTRSRSTLAVNVGNGHTLAAVLEGERISGLVEHHTGMLEPASLEEMLRRFAVGELSDDEVFEAGGHGCIPPDIPVEIDERARVLVTGPRRAMVSSMRMPVELAAPHGDMMLTGCFGLVKAWNRLNAGPSS